LTDGQTVPIPRAVPRRHIDTGDLTLAQQVAVLEEAAAQGRLRGRDLEVIKMQVARAELRLMSRLRALPSRERLVLASRPD
jgi:hypothetical protein